MLQVNLYVDLELLLAYSFICIHTHMAMHTQLLCTNAGLKIDFEDSGNSGSDDSGSEEGGSGPDTGMMIKYIGNRL